MLKPTVCMFVLILIMYFYKSTHRMQPNYTRVAMLSWNVYGLDAALKGYLALLAMCCDILLIYTLLRK